VTVHRLWARAALLLVLALLANPGPAAADDAFPRPAELEPDIAFWVRVYTEIDTDQGFIHDARRLNIVYETIDVPLDARSRSKRIERRREHYRTILLKLASGKRQGLDAEEERVLALFPNPTKSELRRAADDLRFQLGQANRFREGYVRAGAWIPYIQEVFISAGLPADLGFLPHVESSFNPNAYSHAAAAGLWQFTSYTGRRFMRVDHIVDERMDPFLATRAAARLLKENYAELGSWPLALTAYNHGVGGMRRAVRALGTTDIATIVRKYQSRSFGFASRNFYVSFLAALQVEHNAERYFGPIDRAPAETYETLTVDAYLPVSTLARHLDVDREALRASNPALRTPVWKGDKYVPRGFKLRLPSGSSAEVAAAALAAVEAEHRYDAQLPDHTHRVARGETLSAIAARYGLSVKSIVQANGLRSPNQLRAGQVLQLPTGAIGVPESAPAQVAEARAAVAVDGRYVVRRGDSLTKIASRLGVDVRELARHNGIVDAHLIRVGQVLTLPGTGPAVANATDSPAAAGEPYVVRRGDTLAVIARRHGMTEAELARLNDIRNPNLIHPGQKIAVARPPETALKVASAEEEDEEEEADAASAVTDVLPAGTGGPAAPVAAPVAMPLAPQAP
jgi:membrane-bound lytic murein transglycosylase D